MRTMRPIETYLNQLIDESDDGVAQVQLMFHPGLHQHAGGVRRHPEIEGLYEFCTPVQAATDMQTPGGRPIRKGEMCVVSMAFEGEALLQITCPLETSGIIQPPMQGHA